jgi:hypothetical protein
MLEHSPLIPILILPAHSRETKKKKNHKPISQKHIQNQTQNQTQNKIKSKIGGFTHE